MKRILLLSFFVFAYFLGQSQQLWFEDFENTSENTSGNASGTPGGTWSVTTTPSGGTNSFRRQTHFYSRFTIDQTGVGSEGVWQSSVITIPAGKQVAIDISLVSYNAGAGDYVRAYYKLNGSLTEVLFGSAVGGGDYVISQGASVVLTGTSVQIVVRGMENTAGNADSYPRMMRFDDLEVTAVTNLYSRISGDWGSNGTWSSVALGGTSCACTPDNLTNVIVGNSDVVSITGAATAVNITVQNTSTLRWTTDNVALTAARGGSLVVSNTASVDRNGNAGAQIIFPSPAPVAVTVNSSNANALSVGDIVVSGAATLTFSGTGGATMGDDLLVSAGASIVNNLSGTFTVTDDVVLSASNVSITNNGTFTVTSDFGVNASTNAGCTFTNAATRVFNVGTISPSGSNFILNNSGTINQTGDFPNGEFTASTGQLNNLATGTWNFGFSNSGSSDPDVATVLNLSAVGNIFNYTAAGNQNFVTTSYHHLGITGAGSKFLQANIDINGNLSISGASNPSLNSNTRNIALAGNWSMLNSTTFTQGTGTTTVTLDGTADQTISAATGVVSFNNLTINKASGNALLSSTVPTVVGTLTLTNGGLQLNGNTLNITNTATTAIGRTNGFIISETTGTPYSPVVWTMGTVIGSYTFPFGTAAGAANYIPFVFNKTAAGTGAAGRISVATYPTVAANTPFPSGVTHVKNASGANNSANTVDRFWIITPSVYTANPTATLTFTATTAEIGTITTLRGQRWNGTDWDLPLAGASNTATTATVPGVSTFSPWGVSGNNSPLPVELKFFRAAIDGDAVKLDWETAQELNNDFFTVEKTSDLESFEEVVKRAGQGTSTELHHYSEVDANPYFGRSYYRLKQTDFDGNFTYSNVQMIDYSGPEVAFLRAYPSPSKDRQITIEIKGLKETKSIPIQIVNSKGQKVMEKTLQVKTPGSVKEELTFDSSLSSGLYIIKAGSTLQLTQKIVVE